MKVVVFGGSGFLGSHVADELTKRGFDTYIFDVKKSKYLKPNQHIVIGSILDEELVDSTIKDASYVYNFAGIADIHEAQVDPINTIKFNVLGNTYILNACKNNRIKRFIFASSIYVYGEYGSFYRVSKQANELLIQNYYNVYNLNYSILRYGSLYGPRANKFNFIRNAILSALTENKIIRKGSGEEIRDYIHVLDAAKISVDILSKSEYENSHIMITGEQRMRIKDILIMIQEIIKSDVKLVFMENDKLEDHYEITPYAFKPSVARKIVPEFYHDLGQGILDVIYEVYEEIKKNGK